MSTRSCYGWTNYGSTEVYQHGEVDRTAMVGESVRMSTEDAERRFPSNAIGPDSWATVHLIHQRARAHYPDTLNLAYGSCGSIKDIGPKGVSKCYVPWVPRGENIGLSQEGYIWERGCTIERGDTHIIRTPNGNQFDIRVWGSLPYITKKISQDSQRSC